MIGAISAVIVYYFGTLAASSVNATAAAEAVMKEHAGWATWTVWFYGIYTLIRVIFTWRVSNHYHLKYHGVFFLVSLVGMFFLFETGEHGAEMVFGYGTGTGQLAAKQSGQMAKPQSPGFHSKSSGMMNWTIGENPVHTLVNRFAFLQGDTSAAVAAKGDTRMLQFQNPNIFLVTNDDSYSNMQMELNVHPEDYDGDIILAHHIHDAENYGYLALHPDGSAELGHVENGQKSVVEEGSYDRESLETLKLSVSGDHLKGYVNGEQVLHGHSEQPGPGSVGLKLNGNGTFGFSMMKIITVGAEEAHEHGEGEEQHDGE